MLTRTGSRVSPWQLWGCGSSESSSTSATGGGGGSGAQAKWDAGLLDTCEVKDQLPLSKLRVLKLGTLHDNGNGG